MKPVIRYSALAFVVYGLFAVFIVSSFLEIKSNLVHVAAVISFQITLFYLNLLYLIPKFLDQQGRVNYFVITGLILILSTILGGSLDLFLEGYFPIPLIPVHERPVYTYFIGRFGMSVMPLVVSALISRSLKLRSQREEALVLKNKMLEAETKALKAQINPHFLFNALNNIYALAQIKSDKTPDAVLHLSEILRYVTYESNQDFVALKAEIKTMESFISLQELKDDDQSNISVEIDNSNSHYKVAPLLLIAFIENSFKHGNHHDKLNGWIKIKLKAADGNIYLECANSTAHFETTKDKTGGVGLENVRKRLALIYPEKHTLDIRYDQKSYQVNLKIQVTE